ncbi:MAG: sugar ABC transporter substrate-binding protein [Aminipila sp.]
MKRLLILCFILLLITGMVACGNNNESNSQKSINGKSISIMTPYLGSVTTNIMVEELKKGLGEAGANVNVINTNNDFAALASRIEDVVAAKTDAIILVSVDPNQIEIQLQSAFENNIPVFGCDSGLIEGMKMNATSDNYQMGLLIVEYLFNDIMGGKGNVVALTHRPHPGVVKRCEAFDDLLKKNSHIKLITEQHIGAEKPIEDARQTVENLLIANPKEGDITAIFAAWDEPAIGAAQALKEANRTDIVVTGVDGNEQAINLIQEGSPLKATVEQDFSGMSKLVVQEMEKYFKGEDMQLGELYAPAKLITQ